MKLCDKSKVGELMKHYGFSAPDMTITEFIEDELTTISAVPVVRRRNCLHAWIVHSLPGEMYCRMIGAITPPDGYCHRGEYVRNGSD